MIRAYFDRNVFSSLSELEGDLTADDVERLRRAVRSGSLTVYGSPPLLEETAATIGQSREMYRRHMGTVLDLIEPRRLIKSSEGILNSAASAASKRCSRSRASGSARATSSR